MIIMLLVYNNWVRICHDWYENCMLEIDVKSGVWVC